jgi:hypothetical protein
MQQPTASFGLAGIDRDPGPIHSMGWTTRGPKFHFRKNAFDKGEYFLSPLLIHANPRGNLATPSEARKRSLALSQQTLTRQWRWISPSQTAAATLLGWRRLPTVQPSSSSSSPSPLSPRPRVGLMNLFHFVLDLWLLASYSHAWMCSCGPSLHPCTAWLPLCLLPVDSSVPGEVSGLD